MRCRRVMQNDLEDFGTEKVGDAIVEHAITAGTVLLSRNRGRIVA